MPRKDNNQFWTSDSFEVHWLLEVQQNQTLAFRHIPKHQNNTRTLPLIVVLQFFCQMMTVCESQEPKKFVLTFCSFHTALRVYQRSTDLHGFNCDQLQFHVPKYIYINSYYICSFKDNSLLSSFTKITKFQLSFFKKNTFIQKLWGDLKLWNQGICDINTMVEIPLHNSACLISIISAGVEKVLLIKSFL